MKDINYDLVKLLTRKMNTIWCLEKFYCQDAAEADCESLDTLKQILAAEKEHAKLLRKEIKKRIDAGVFN